jgi:hypothetical protein
VTEIDGGGGGGGSATASLATALAGAEAHVTSVTGGAVQEAWEPPTVEGKNASLIWFDLEAIGASITIGGIKAPAAGQPTRMVLVKTSTTKFLLFKHEAGTAEAKNRIVSDTGGNVEVTSTLKGRVELEYDREIERWFFPTPFIPSNSVSHEALRENVVFYNNIKTIADAENPAAGAIKTIAEHVVGAGFRARLQGNNVLTEFTITHNLGTVQPVVALWKITHEQEEVEEWETAEPVSILGTEPRLHAVNANSIKLTFAVHPAIGTVYWVTVMR